MLRCRQHGQALGVISVEVFVHCKYDWMSSSYAFWRELCNAMANLLHCCGYVEQIL